MCEHDMCYDNGCTGCGECAPEPRVFGGISSFEDAIDEFEYLFGEIDEETEQLLEEIFE